MCVCVRERERERERGIEITRPILPMTLKTLFCRIKVCVCECVRKREREKR